MNDWWIKVHRRILEWEWFDHPKMLQFFLRLIFKANFEPKQWQGVTIERGQFVCSWEQLSESVGLSIQTTRTMLSKLERTGEITRKSTNKFTIITICKYDSYQSSAAISDQTINKQLTNNQQTTNKQLTTTKEREESKERKELIKESIKGQPAPSHEQTKIKYAESVTMKETEYQKLIAEHGKELTKKCIEKLSAYKTSKGKRYKSDYAAILSWVLKDQKQAITNPNANSSPFS